MALLDTHVLAMTLREHRTGMPMMAWGMTFRTTIHTFPNLSLGRRGKNSGKGMSKLCSSLSHGRLPKLWPCSQRACPLWSSTSTSSGCISRLMTTLVNTVLPLGTEGSCFPTSNHIITKCFALRCKTWRQRPKSLTQFSCLVQRQAKVFGRYKLC